MKTKHTPTPWKYAVNVGPTKALIVEEDGSTIMECHNSMRSSKFENNVRAMIHRVNQHDALVEALKRISSMYVLSEYGYPASELVRSVLAKLEQGEK